MRQTRPSLIIKTKLRAQIDKNRWKIFLCSTCFFSTVKYNLKQVLITSIYSTLLVFIFSCVKMCQVLWYTHIPNVYQTILPGTYMLTNKHVKTTKSYDVYTYLTLWLFAACFDHFLVILIIFFTILLLYKDHIWIWLIY